MNVSKGDGIEPLRESSIPSRSRNRDVILTMRLLSLSRELFECVEIVGSYEVRGRKPEEAQTGADFTYPCFTKDNVIPAMSLEDDCLYDGQASATIRRLNETHTLLSMEGATLERP